MRAARCALIGPGQRAFAAYSRRVDRPLLEVCRYVELNPVRAGMVAAPGDWPWSSYRAHVGTLGDQSGPPWLDTAGLHGYLLGRPATTAADHRRAGRQYAALVAQGLGVALWSDGLRQQIYLGDEDFVERMQALAEPPRKTTRDTPRAQRMAPRPLAHWLGMSASREEALYRAHTEGGLTMTALAAELGLSVSRVSRLIARAESAAAAPPARKRR